MRTFDELITIFENLSEEDYKLTEKAAADYYNEGSTDLLKRVSDKIGVTEDEILLMW